MTFIFYFPLIIGITFLITLPQLPIIDIVNSQLVTQNSNKSFFIDSNQSLSIIDVEFPLFWNKNIDHEENTLSIISPLKNVGVIIQYIPDFDKSIDEVTMNMIKYVNKNLQNSEIQQIEERNIGKDNEIQTIILKYGNNLAFYKVSQIWKHTQNQLFIFTYFAPENLFDRFNSTAMEIYKSFRILSNEQPQHNHLNSTALSTSITFNNSSKNNITSDNISQYTTHQAINLDNLVTYHNKSTGIKLQYPSSFELLEKNNGVSIFYDQGKVRAAVGFLPLSNRTVDEFVYERLNFLNGTLYNFNVLNFSQSSLFGYPTNMLFYEYTSINGKQTNNAVELWKIEGNRINIFTIYVPEDSFNTFLPVISSLIESLKWNEYV